MTDPLDPAPAARPSTEVRAARAARFDRVLGAYDIRGRIGVDLDADLLFSLGHGTARHMREDRGAASVVIGCDMRPDSLDFARLLAAGVAAAGSRPVLLGLCSTDQLYFATGHFELPGLMVTASHNPADWNGIKICGPRAAGLSRADGLTAIRDLALEAPALGPDPVLPVIDESAAAEVAHEYSRRLRELTDLEGTGRRRLRIVADCGNGMAGKLLPEVFGTAAGLAGVDLEIIGLYTELDGTFPNHVANPLIPENLLDAQAAVKEHGADLGLVFDGDADRCFFIDETGAATSASAIGALVATAEIARARAEGEDVPVVLHNLITSRAVPEAIEAAGGRAVRTPVGHSGIKQLMVAHHAVFACEHSAHFYFRDFFCADSGMLAACHLIAALATSTDTLSDLLADFEPYVGSGEINSTVADAEAVLTSVTEAMESGRLGAGTVDTLDGVTLTGSDFWVNVRKSNTEPLVRLNCETPNAARTEELVTTALALIRTGGHA